MPRILSNSICALWRLVKEKMACWYSRSITDGLLYMYFICNVFWACYDVIVLVSNVVK